MKQTLIVFSVLVFIAGFLNTMQGKPGNIIGAIALVLFIWLVYFIIITVIGLFKRKPSLPKPSDEAQKTLIQKEDGAFEFSNQATTTEIINSQEELSLTWNEKLVNLWRRSKFFRVFCFVSGCWIAIITAITFMSDPYGPFGDWPYWVDENYWSIAFVPVVFGGFMAYIYKRYIK